MMKGEFAVVDYVGYESTYSDILALENVRHTNTKYVHLCGRVCGCGLVWCCHYCELCVKCSVMTLQCVNRHVLYQWATLTFDLAFRWAFCWAKVRSKSRIQSEIKAISLSVRLRPNLRSKQYRLRPKLSWTLVLAILRSCRNNAYLLTYRYLSIEAEGCCVDYIISVSPLLDDILIISCS